MNTAAQGTYCPLVSIVVPVWNAEKFLPACLDSILAQTMPDWECILVDDGSTDGSGKICDEYAAQDSRFVVIHQENKWVAAARNAGMDRARGKYLNFLDSDDQFHPQLLELTVRAIQEVPDSFVCWRYTRDKSIWTTKQMTGDWKIYSLDESFFIRRVLYWAPWNKLYERKQVVESGIRFQEDWFARNKTVGEDEDFQYRLWSALHKADVRSFCVIDEPLYFWNPGNEKSLTHVLPTITNSNENAKKELLQKNYWANIYSIMACHQTLYPDKNHAWPWDLTIMRRSYLKQLAYGLCCAKSNKEKTPPLGHCKELTALLNSCKAEKTWSPYYLPFRLRQKWVVRFIYRLDESENRNFGRFDWGFYYLLGGKWNR